MSQPSPQAPLDPADLPDNAVAVVGMACHFPGAPDLDHFWRNLRDGVDSITHFTDEELLEAGVDPALLQKPNYVKANGILRRMEWFDAGFFGLSPREAAVMDPQSRHILECAWHALEHAGHVPERFPGSIGVFAGAGAARYFWQNVVRDPELLRDMGYFLLRHAGNDKDFVATRISYELNLTGPGIAIQTACSTSLVAVHYACQSLLSWECDMALAGAVTIDQPHVRGYMHEPGEVLAKDGTCRSYDHQSTGTVFGSGAGIVVLRRLADALEDGDTIHALVLGSAVNNDGAGKVSYLAPSVEGQAKAISEALQVAGVEADTIGLVEGHGTGTPVGDPIEVTALTQAYRTQTDRVGYCALGSVKSNIGHLDTAAGVASMIKATLALQHGQIPPTVHFERPNPLLQLETSPLYVNSELVEWPADLSPRRAGVTSLGIGGTNAHVVLQEPPRARVSGPSRPWQLLALSARSAAALEDATRGLVDFLETNPRAPLPDVAHTLRVGRRRFSHRRAVVCRTAAEAIEALGTSQGVGFTTGTSDAERREVAFLFAGGGAQYPNMGRELYESEPTFREAADRCFEHLAKKEGLDLRGLLFCDPEGEEQAALELQRPSRALPALFAIQYAQARLWMSWGVSPAAMIGHSMGEYTAACLADVFSPEDGMSLVSLRGRLFETLERGAMLSVSLSEEELRSRLDASLSIAALNAPEVSVASGPVDAIAALEARLAEEGVDARRVRIDVAAHSSMLEPILGEFGAYVRGLRLSPPQLPVISNLTGKVAGPEVTQADYWVRHLRETVRFSDGLAQLMRADGPVLLEVGPGRTLATVARMHSAWSSSQPVLYSLPHPTERSDAQAFQLGALGALWAAGVDPDWDGFVRGEVRNRIPLPGYPFERAPYYVAPPTAVGEAAAAAPGDTARRADVADWFQKVHWVATPDPTAGEDEQAEHAPVLFLLDAGGLGEEVAARLEGSGRRVLRVQSGPGYAASPGDRFTIRPGSAEDWRALVQGLAGAESLPGVVVHAWCLEETAPDAPEDEQERAFFAPLHLLQAVEGTAPGHALRLVALTSGAVAAGGDERLRPGRAQLLGPVRVAPKEIPSVRARLGDVGAVPHDPGRRAYVADRLLQEVVGSAPETVVARRGPERLTERFDTVRIGPADLGRVVREGGVYLVTGGLGGIGLVVAKELAGHGPIRLALLGRKALPSPEDRAGWIASHGEGDKVSRAIREVEELERMGAEVLDVAADVTDRRRMREVVDLVVERFGALHGIVHAAGVLDDGPLLARDAAQARAVLGPKVAGTLAIDAAIEGMELDFFVLFSSTSAVIGAPGQIDYTAANSFLDAYARARAARTGQRTLSLAWGAWRDVGMAAELAGEARYDARGEDLEDVREIEHPLFDQRVSHGDGRRSFRTRFVQGRHWMLDEHQVRGGPWVLPGSGYVEVVRAALHEVAPDAPFALRDLVFMRPFRIGEGEARDLEVRLTPSDGGWAVAVRGRAPGSGSTWIEHATASVAPIDAAAPEPLEDVRARVGSPKKVERPPHPVMNFGPRWANVVEQVSSGSEVLLRHDLTPYEADFADTPLHPALLDMATAGAQHLVPGTDLSKDLFVPTGYGSLRMWAALRPDARTHIVLRTAEPDGTLATFDVTVYDAAGRPTLMVRDFSMMRIDGSALAQGAVEEGPAWLLAAMSPREGRDAFRRALAADTGSHVLVSTRPLDALIAESGSAPVRSRRVEGPRRVASRVLVPAVVEALEAFEAVSEATAIGTPDAEQARVVAFVVYEQGRHATVSELRRFLRSRVDKRLVPQNFVEMVSLPRGPDGEVSVGELRDPFAAVDDFIAPRTPTEIQIAGIWSELLALDRVGIHDNFLDVGGHSLVGVRVLRRIQQETGVRIEANALTMQTLEQLAAEIDRLTGASGGDAGAPETEGAGRRPAREADVHAVPVER